MSRTASYDGEPAPWVTRKLPRFLTLYRARTNCEKRGGMKRRPSPVLAELDRDLLRLRRCARAGCGGRSRRTRRRARAFLCHPGRGRSDRAGGSAGRAGNRPPPPLRHRQRRTRRLRRAGPHGTTAVFHVAATATSFPGDGFGSTGATLTTTRGPGGARPPPPASQPRRASLSRHR